MMFKNQWLNKGLYLVGMVISVVGAVLLTLWLQNPKDSKCPKVINANRFSLSYSLYYMKNDGEAHLWSFREGELQKLGIEVTSAFRISPDGTELLHMLVPQDEEQPASITILDLPLTKDDSISKGRGINLPYAWSSRVFGVEWMDARHIIFHSRKDTAIETAILDINSAEHHSIHWSFPPDSWDQGAIVIDDSLNYFVYADRGVEDKHKLHLVALSQPDTAYDLLPGDIYTVRWQAGTESFIFQSSDYKWYRINASDVITGHPNLGAWNGISDFHSGVGARLFNPALSPDGQLLMAQAYLPNEQLSTLLMLSEGAGVGDLCLHGDYLVNATRGEFRSGEWSQDSRYFAFSMYAGDQAGIYIYDVEKHVIGLVDTLKGTATADIIGWGY